MQPIEIFTIIIAVAILSLPIILKFIERKKGQCSHVCDTCGKKCPLRDIKNNFKE